VANATTERAAYATSALLGAVGVVLLGLAWRDGVAGYEAALRIVGAYHMTGSLAWDGPSLAGLRSFYEWLTLTTTGHVVVSAIGCSVALGAALVAPARTGTVAQLTRIANASIAVLICALLLMTGPAVWLHHGRDALGRELWAMQWVRSAAEIDLWACCGACLLAAWVVAMAAVSRVSVAAMRNGPVVILVVGAGAFFAARPLATMSRVRVSEDSYPLGLSERFLPRTPERVGASGRWQRWCSDDYGRRYCDSSPGLYGRQDFEHDLVRSWAILHPSRPPSRDVPFATRASASLSALRDWLDVFRDGRNPSILAVTTAETLTPRTSMFGLVHLGTRTVVTLPIACLDSLANEVSWGDAVARCAGDGVAQLGGPPEMTGPLL